MREQLAILTEVEDRAVQPAAAAQGCSSQLVREHEVITDKVRCLWRLAWLRLRNAQVGCLVLRSDLDRWQAGQARVVYLS